MASQAFLCAIISVKRSTSRNPVLPLMMSESLLSYILLATMTQLCVCGCP